MSHVAMVTICTHFQICIASFGIKSASFGFVVAESFNVKASMSGREGRWRNYRKYSLLIWLLEYGGVVSPSGIRHINGLLIWIELGLYNTHTHGHVEHVSNTCTCTYQELTNQTHRTSTTNGLSRNILIQGNYSRTVFKSFFSLTRFSFMTLSSLVNANSAAALWKAG